MSGALDHMSLSILSGRGVLDGYEPPVGEFDPNGDWDLTYDVYSLAPDSPSSSGTLQIQRTVQGAGTARLAVDYAKNVSGGYRQEVVATIDCRTDALSTPTSWAYSSQIKSGSVFPDTRVDKVGALEDGNIVITDEGGAHRHEIPEPDAYTINWALFDAVQRLPREPSAAFQFTMLDHFDQVKGNQTLSFEKTVNVTLQRAWVQERRQLEKGWLTRTSWGFPEGAEVLLHAYDHVGEGIVPWVYWVDGQGRLVFAVSGIEAYVLKAS